MKTLRTIKIGDHARIDVERFEDIGVVVVLSQWTLPGEPAGSSSTVALSRGHVRELVDALLATVLEEDPQKPAASAPSHA